MTNWWIILAVSATTFLTRAGFILLSRRPLPEAIKFALTLVPVAVLSAFVTPDLLLKGEQAGMLNPRLIAGLVAAGVAWRTRNVLLTLFVGMGLLALLTAF